jgi:hypothetical protein
MRIKPLRAPLLRGRPGARALSYGLVAVAIGGVAWFFYRPEGGPSGLPTVAAAEAGDDAFEEHAFDALVGRYRDKPFNELYSQLNRPRPLTQALAFDPTQAKYFDRVKQSLGLTNAEVALFRRNGFVAVDLIPPFSFGSAYYEAYRHDLPVLVTTDSILHAMHRSFDQILGEIEVTWLAPTLAEILQGCHEALDRRGRTDQDAILARSHRDVDLYLTVARNLLAGAGGPAPEAGTADKPDSQGDRWKGELLVKSQFAQDEEVLARLKDIQSLILQTPGGPSTPIYGGSRWIDYSQFRPRGHYTTSIDLRRYFRCMMWLGRADCGWNVLSKESTPGRDPSLRIDTDRELRDAVLLAELLRESNGLGPLKSMDDVIQFLIGRSDNVTVFALLDWMRDRKVETLAAAGDDTALARLRDVIRDHASARQLIRSEVIPATNDPYTKAPLPDKFQMFGQRFVIDSFILSQVVFDSILNHGQKIPRMIPKGLDVMAALGNDAAVPLLKDELAQWSYAANLLACRELLDFHKPGFWGANLYNRWLDCIRTLDDDLSGSPYFPEAMRTHAWQMKQLQTQHASWAELRHDTILYAKQSYTGFLCEYPAGYVEPYPQLFAKVKSLGEEAARLLGKVEPTTKDPQQARWVKQAHQRWMGFFTKMAGTVGRLGALAQKELNAEPFTAEDVAFLKRIIDARGGGSGPPRYDGWYADLFYNRGEVMKREPTVADVHTDPNTGRVLEVAVGDAHFGVIVVDNGPDRAVYVGPIYSYYEFLQEAPSRLTDEEWVARLQKGRVPGRPAWTQEFQASARPRPPERALPKGTVRSSESDRRPRATNSGDRLIWSRFGRTD